MKKIMTVIVLVALMTPAAALAQPQTLVGGDLDHGGFGGPTVQFTQIGGELGLLVGGGGGWVIGQTITIGGAGYGLATTHLVNDGTDDYELGLGYGGLLIEYMKQPDDLIHWYVSCLFGLGGVSFREPGAYVDIDPGTSDDLIYVLEPSVNICLNVTEFMRVAAGAGYRQITGIDEESIALGLEKTGLTGASFNISFRFGKY